MRLRQLADRLEYTVLRGSDDIEVTSLVYDSRKAEGGCLFVCLSGFSVDGHAYISEVAEKGAAAVVVEKDCCVPEGVTVLRVENTRAALAVLSAAWFGHPAEAMTIIGITGTKGKTTASHMLRSILEADGKKTGLIGTLGAVIGDKRIPTRNTTPESYELHSFFSAMKNAGCRYVVMECSSQGFKMRRTSGVRFNIGIFLNLSADHIGEGEHKDFNEYLECKRMLFSQCDIGVVNADDPNTPNILAGGTCREIYTFSVDKDADMRGIDAVTLRERDFLGVRFNVASHRINGEICLGMPGLYNVQNALAAILAAELLGVSSDSVGRGLRSVRVKGRTQVLPTEANYTLLIDYAHNALSMESLLSVLKSYRPSRLICVFGGGGNRDRSRRTDMGKISGRLSDLTVLTTDNPRFESVSDINADIKRGLAVYGGKYIEIDDRARAIRYVIDNARDGDIIALIGKGHEEYQDIKGVKYPFSEERIVRDCIARKTNKV